MNPCIFSIRSQVGGDISFTDTIPDILTDLLLPGARPFLAKCPSGYFLIQEITSQDFSLWHHTVLLIEDDSFQITCNEPLLSLNFCLQNNFHLCRKGLGKHLDFQEGEYNMSFLPQMDFIADFPKDRVHSFLTLFYSQTYLTKIANVYPRVAVFLDKINRKEETFLYEANQFITKEMRKSIFDMLQAGCKDKETSICIKKGRALEILVASLEPTTHQLSPSHIGLTRYDQERIFAAKDWLDQQYHRPITLFELSKKVGTNVHKLSSGFLLLMGTTIFNYHRNVRMNKAIQLLEETDRSFFDIGTEIGYSDGKTFSKEFKKENGISPLEYRKRYRIPQA